MGPEGATPFPREQSVNGRQTFTGHRSTTDSLVMTCNRATNCKPAFLHSPGDAVDCSTELRSARTTRYPVFSSNPREKQTTTSSSNPLKNHRGMERRNRIQRSSKDYQSLPLVSHSYIRSIRARTFATTNSVDSTNNTTTINSASHVAHRTQQSKFRRVGSSEFGKSSV